MDYMLEAVSAKELAEAHKNKLTGVFPALWSPEIYNNPYNFPGIHWAWPITESEQSIVVFLDADPPFAVWRQ